MSGFRSASLIDTAQFNRLVIIPNAAQGLFKRRATAVAIATATDVDGAAVRLLAGMRKRYDGGPVWIHVMRDRQLLLLDVDDVREVLENSPDPYASDPPAKRNGMAAFQPEALTISRDGEWKQRREIAEAALHETPPVEAVGEEVEALLGDGTTELRFAPFNEAFQRATRRIVLGDGAADDTELTGLLGKAMSDGNGMPGKPSEAYEPLLARIAAHDGGLAVGVPASQVVHWLFALGDTAAMNAFRALALIAAHPTVAARAGRGDAPYLRACLQDAMRLYPTTPMLARETTEDVELRGEIVPAGTAVLFVNLFHHRDRARVAYADRFAPEEWLDGDAAARWDFNHFSHGPQGCPGVDLALQAGVAALTAVLVDGEATLHSPKLDPGKPLPHMLDVFSARVGVAR